VDPSYVSEIYEKMIDLMRLSFDEKDNPSKESEFVSKGGSITIF
jgi:hypothetical protein